MGATFTPTPLADALPSMSGFEPERRGIPRCEWTSPCYLLADRDLAVGEVVCVWAVCKVDGRVLKTVELTATAANCKKDKWPAALVKAIRDDKTLVDGSTLINAGVIKGATFDVGTVVRTTTEFLAAASNTDLNRLWVYSTRARLFTNAPFASNQVIANNLADVDLSAERLCVQVRDRISQGLHESIMVTLKPGSDDAARAKALCVAAAKQSKMLSTTVQGNALCIPQLSGLAVTVEPAGWLVHGDFKASRALKADETLAIYVHDDVVGVPLPGSPLLFTPKAAELKPAKWAAALASALKASPLAQYLALELADGAEATTGKWKRAGVALRVVMSEPLETIEQWQPMSLEFSGLEETEVQVELFDRRTGYVWYRSEVEWGSNAASESTSWIKAKCALFAEPEPSGASLPTDAKIFSLPLRLGAAAQVVAVASDSSNFYNGLGSLGIGCASRESLFESLMRMAFDDTKDNSYFSVYSFFISISGYLQGPALSYLSLGADSVYAAEVELAVEKKDFSKISKGCLSAIYRLGISGGNVWRGGWFCGVRSLESSVCFLPNRGGGLMQMQTHCVRSSIGSGRDMLTEFVEVDPDYPGAGYYPYGSLVHLEFGSEASGTDIRFLPYEAARQSIDVFWPAWVTMASASVVGACITSQSPWSKPFSVSITRPDDNIASFSPDDTLCADRCMTLGAHVYDTGGARENGVDENTGLFHAHYPVATLRGLGGKGPELDLTLHYSAVRANESALGDGWAFRFSYFDNRRRVLTLSSGQTLTLTKAQMNTLSADKTKYLDQDGYRITAVEGTADAWTALTLQTPPGSGGREEVLTLPAKHDKQEAGEGFKRQYKEKLETIIANLTQWIDKEKLTTEQIKEREEQREYWRAELSEIDRKGLVLVTSSIRSPQGGELQLAWEGLKGHIRLQDIKDKATQTLLLSATHGAPTKQGAIQSVLTIWPDKPESYQITLDIRNCLLTSLKRHTAGDVAKAQRHVRFGYDTDYALDRVLTSIAEEDGSVEVARYNQHYSNSAPRVQMHTLLPGAGQQNISHAYEWEGDYLVEKVCKRQHGAAEPGSEPFVQTTWTLANGMRVVDAVIEEQPGASRRTTRFTYPATAADGACKPLLLSRPTKIEVTTEAL